VRTKPCGEVNAFYDPDEWTVNICYDWIDATETMAPQGTSPDGFSRQEVHRRRLRGGSCCTRWGMP